MVVFLPAEAESVVEEQNPHAAVEDCQSRWTSGRWSVEPADGGRQPTAVDFVLFVS
jgi:hypothetical protein